MKETYLFFKKKQAQKSKLFLDMSFPKILGLTAIPLTLGKNRNLEYSDIHNNLLDLCRNLDSNYLDFDYDSVKNHISEAEIAYVTYKNQNIIYH